MKSETNRDDILYGCCPQKATVWLWWWFWKVFLTIPWVIWYHTGDFPQHALMFFSPLWYHCSFWSEQLFNCALTPVSPDKKSLLLVLCTYSGTSIITNSLSCTYWKLENVCTPTHWALTFGDQIKQLYLMNYYMNNRAVVKSRSLEHILM